MSAHRMTFGQGFWRCTCHDWGTTINSARAHIAEFSARFALTPRRSS